MEQILNGCVGCLNFIDDIIVYGETENEHDERVRKIVKRLKDMNVTMNREKCIFKVTEMDFLGHHLSAKGITPMYDKVSAIKQFREPANSEEVRSFLGLVNYVGKFIPNLATVTEPLRKLTRHDTKFEWEKDQRESFAKLKCALTNEVTLGYYNVRDRTQVIADASPVGLGAVLLQYDDQGPRIISYASRSLTNVERKYAQTEKEALALIWSVERFHYYLFGRTFELVTDHKALETLFAPKSKPCARLERWVMRLMSYKFTVIYKPGKTNIADPLSRLAISEETPSNNGNEADCYVKWILSQSEPKAIKLREIDEKSKNDEIIQAVKQAMDTNVWNEASTPFKFIMNELCFAGNILMRGTRIVMPNALKEQLLHLAHEGHPGKSVMKRRLRAKVWWPKIDQDAELIVDQCRGCKLVGAPSAPEPLIRKQLPAEPWKNLAVDFCGPLPSGHHIFVVIDYYSRFKEVEIMKKIDAFDTIKRCEVMFARFGLPVTITVDNGRQFVGHEFKQYCDTNNIDLNETIPYWPQMNGEVERQNQSLLKRLRICQEEKGDWREDLQKYLLMYRSTPHSTTLRAPAELMFNRNIRDKLPSIHQPLEKDEELHDRDKLMKQKGKEYADEKRGAKPSELKEGDKVYMLRQTMGNKLSTRFDPTVFTVVNRAGSELIIENVETGTRYRRNVAHVTKVELEPNQSFSFSAQPPLASSTTQIAQTATSQQLTTPVGTLTLAHKRASSPSTNSRRQQPPRKRTMPQRYTNFIGETPINELL